MTCSDAISFVGCSGMLAKQVLFQLSYSPREKALLTGGSAARSLTTAYRCRGSRR
jgi:hypothetical protein